MLDMAERKATKTLVSVRVNSRALSRLDELATLRGRTRSELIDRAVEEFLTREVPPPTPPAVRSPRMRPQGKPG